MFRMRRIGMDIKVSPSVLHGSLSVPSSKSCAHRALICAALADGVSEISGISISEDIKATLGALSALGAVTDIREDNTISVTGIKKPNKSAVIDCNESGSTLRFLIPVAAALGCDTVFSGRGRLPERPIDIYVRELSEKGISFDYDNTMPFSISGKLEPGVYEIEGNISSQFITGLLFALPLLGGDSFIRLKSRPESKPYIDITIAYLRYFGIKIDESEQGYHVKGGQAYRPADIETEGDYSQAAFFFTANALGSDIKINNLRGDSVQGDRKILEIIDGMRGSDGIYRSFEADCRDIPDLVPILAVLGCFGTEESVIYNAARLRIKESDRLAAVSDMLNRIGGDVSVTGDGLIIRPVKGFRGGTVDSFGDHRIVMSAAIAALRSDHDIIIKGAEAVRKSYPDFFEDYKKLGGAADVITLE